MERGAVLITGASTGIGEATARHLAGMGFQVFATVRREHDGAALAARSRNIHPVIMEVTDEPSITAAAEQVAGLTGARGLTGLVNNAGICVGGPLEFLPAEELRRQLEVNVIGYHAVTRAFLPLIRQGRGRIVNITSMFGRVALPMVGPYNASKFALEALSAALRMELKPWSIPVSVIGPGSILTPIWAKSIAAADHAMAELPADARQLYGSMYAAVRKSQDLLGRSGIPADRVARTVARALTARKPRPRYTVGLDARLAEWVRWLPTGVRERLALAGLGIS